MLTEQNCKEVAKHFAQYASDYEKVTAAQKQAEKSWDNVIATLESYKQLEDSDREAIIKECREQGWASPFLIKSVHRAFDMLGIVGVVPAPQGVPEEVKPNRRTAVIRAAVDQAMEGKKQGRRMPKKRTETLAKIEKEVQKGRGKNALGILKRKLIELYEPIGQLIRDNYDLMTIEEAMRIGSEEFVEMWHSAFDDAIAKEKAQFEAHTKAKKDKKANGEK